MVLKHISGSSPQLPTLLDFGQEPSSLTYFLVYDFFPGGTLKDFIERQYSLKEVAQVMASLLGGVQATHSKGIFHRDLKPQNILVNDRNEIRIIDWGLAEFYLPNQEYNLAVSTRPYKCPEILMGIKTYDYSFDMWNVGQILFCLLFKRLFLVKGKDNHD